MRGHQGIPARGVVPARCHSPGSVVDAYSDAPAGAQRAERVADGGVVYISRAPSVSQVHGELMRSTLLDLTPIPTVSSLMIPLIYSHINGFQRASSMEKPWPGGENKRGGRAAPPVAW